MKIKIVSLQKVLIAGVVFGALLCAGVYFPLINFSPAFMILLLINGLFLIANWFTNKGKILFEPELKKTVYSIGIMIISSLVALLINGYGLNDGFVLIVMSFLLGISVYETISSSDDIQFYLNFYVIISAVSALVQIGQVLHISFCYDIWKLLQQGDAVEHYATVNRYLGLSSNLINFSLQISAAYTIVLTTKYEKKFWRVLKYPLLILFAVSVWMSETRSGMIAILLVSLIAFLQYTKKKGNRLIKILVIVFAMICIVIVYDYFMVIMYGSRLFTAVGTKGTLARVPMFFTAINHAVHYPLGMGVYYVRPEYIIDSGGYYSEVLNNAAHNLFANCVASYGWIAVVALVAFYIEVFKAYLVSRKIADKRLSEQINTAILCVVALLISSLTHNKYILNGDFSAHIFISIVLSIYKLTKEVDYHESGSEDSVEDSSEVL